MTHAVGDSSKSEPPPGYTPLWRDPPSLAPVGPPPGPAEPPPLSPLSRRLMAAAVVLSVLLLAVILNWLLHSDKNPFNPIAAAAVRTQAAPGARYSIKVVYSSKASNRTVVGHGAGVYNSRTGRGRATLTVDAGLEKQKIVSVADARSLYLRSRSLSAGLPPSRHWLEMQPFLGRTDQAARIGGASAGDQLAYLRAVASDVESLGPAEVRGARTDRYRGTIELDHYAQLLREEGKPGTARIYESFAKQMPAPIEVEVWVDGGGMVRRLREVIMVPTKPGSPPLRADMRMDFLEFGVSPTVKLPAAREVFDSTPLTRVELGLVNGETANRMIAPAGAPLSAPAFGRRGATVCRGIERRLDALRRKAAPAYAELERYAREGGPSAHSSQQTLRVFRAISFAYFEPGLRTIERGLRRLGRLAPPAARAAAFHRYIRKSAEYLELDLAETRAAELGEMKLAQSISNRLHPLVPTIKRATRAAGLPPVCAIEDEPESTRSATTGQPS